MRMSGGYTNTQRLSKTSRILSAKVNFSINSESNSDEDSKD